jgi:hypothetical protein
LGSGAAKARAGMAHDTAMPMTKKSFVNLAVDRESVIANLQKIKAA